MRIVLILCLALAAFCHPARAADGKIVYEKADGTVICELKPRDDGYTIHDGQDHKIGTVRVAGDRVKLKDENDVELWKVKRKESGDAEVEDGNGQQLYKAKRDDDGVWKLKDPAGTSLFKMKPKPDGFEVRNPAGDTVAKVKTRDGRLAFETESGERLAVAKGITDAHAGMWLAVDTLTPRERAALVVYFLRVATPP